MFNKKPRMADDFANSDGDVESIMRKYDRESNTRIWEGKPALTPVAFPGVPSGAVARESAMLGPDVLTVYYPQ